MSVVLHHVQMRMRQTHTPLNMFSMPAHNDINRNSSCSVHSIHP